MVEKLLDDLNRAHEGLQHLRIEATKGNVAIIWDALTALENANAFIETLKVQPKSDTTVKESEPDA